MSSLSLIVRDAAIGEIREAYISADKVITLRLVRASEEGAHARWGELYAGRVLKVDSALRGAFVDLGLGGEQGFLPLGAKGGVRPKRGQETPLHEGMGLVVSVAREGARGKGPVLDLIEQRADLDRPQRLEQAECDLELASAKPAPREMRMLIDEAIDEALARVAPIPGGGALTIEPTAALVAIDVDAGARVASRQQDQFALELNIAAVKEVARQLRLRSLGGLIAIDFVSMRRKPDLARLDQAIRAAFAGDPWSIQFGGFSRFGVYELSRAQLRAPLHETMRESDGRMKTETIALIALRALEREARIVTGRPIACEVSAEVKAWLDAAPFDWRGDLSNRIGMRWTLDAAPGSRDRVDVRAL
jgi:Ribonuclease G/E